MFCYVGGKGQNSNPATMGVEDVNKSENPHRSMEQIILFARKFPNVKVQHV